jgi:hypothetical protein
MNVNERARLYSEAFTEAGGDGVVAAAQLAYIVESLTDESGTVDQEENLDLDELAWGFESLGIEQSRARSPEEDVIAVFDIAFKIRTGMVAEGLVVDLRTLWILMTAGVGSQNQPQLREILTEYQWAQLDAVASDSWEDVVLRESTRAVFFLTRKSRGWQDVDDALYALNRLVEMQSELEVQSLESDSNTSSSQAARLLGLYHLAESLNLLGRYLRTGSPESVMPAIERHVEHCRSLFVDAGDISLGQIADCASILLPSLVRASIWYNTARVSQAARNFALRLVAPDNANPVLELWWGQRQALGSNLLDPFKVAIGVQMPTSAGKTLLAEFTIVQALALNPGSTVAYIVPTRALVSQITRRLRQDLSGALIDSRTVTVESAVPVFELDPTEDSMLQNVPDILVTTPEKMDLLVRSGHPCVRSISLVVVDEAHHISEPGRGPRLELLLATLKRERGTSCRFLLLTPFLPNASELSEWLGDEAFTAISLDWRPSLQVRTIGKWARKNKQYSDALQVVPSVTQPASWDGHLINLGISKFQPNSRSRPQISTSIAASLAATGSTTLILTRGAGTAETRAMELANVLPPPLLNAEQAQILDDVISYIKSELGSDYPLVATLRSGVAFHHAGMPPEVRALVENLLERGIVSQVAGTTTLAQGVNFPLSTVIVESLTVPQGRGKKHRDLQYSEFWNIAGRAGRALKDRIGLVVWPSAGRADDKKFAEYLKGEASRVVSALAQTLVTLDDAGDKYDLNLVRSNPALSSFLQYLAHALRVAGYEQAMANVEDILRSSLVFHRMRQEDRESAEKLVQWSRGFLRDTRNKGLLNVADTTGLSLPSVGLLSSTATAEMHDPEFWLPDNIFAEDLSSLTQVISLIADVPEMSLGLSDEPGQFNAGRVARIVRGWVVGATLPDLARECFPNQDLKSSLREVGRYLFRDLAGQVPWGIGALQLIAMGNDSRSEASPASYVPAMAYYGVRSEAAVAMRMVGVPRPAAESLGARAPQFGSFELAREWLRDSPDSWWQEAAGEHDLSGVALRRVWELVGPS